MSAPQSSAPQSIKLNTQEYFDNAYKGLLLEFPDVNIFALPKIDKIIVSSGVGKYDNKVKQEIGEYLEKITGQKAKKVPAKVSISSFKLRKGDTVSQMVTLNGKKARDFLFQLVTVALPRTRDFKGIKSTSFDKNYRCYSTGIENASIFTAVGFDTGFNFGVQVSICFKTGTPNNLNYLHQLKLPFKKS